MKKIELDKDLILEPFQLENKYTQNAYVSRFRRIPNIFTTTRLIYLM